MSLGENLQFLRKKQDITQEQLAEALNVSRQSISKWESDSTYPEMDKLLQLSKMFHCSLDDLMQKDVSTQYVEDKANYDNHKNHISKLITAGVGFIMAGVTVLLFLTSILPNTERFEYLSIIVFFLFLVIGITILVLAGLQNDHFEKKYPFVENFYTEDEKEEFHKKFTILCTVGVALIFIGLIAMLTMYFVFPDIEEMNTLFDMETLSAVLFLLFVTVSVILFVYAGTQNEKYDTDNYNEMHDVNSLTYKKSKKTGLACAIIMMTATIIFFLFGFLQDKWQYAAVIYSSAGIICGIAAIIINNTIKTNRQ